MVITFGDAIHVISETTYASLSMETSREWTEHYCRGKFVSLRPNASIIKGWLCPICGANRMPRAILDRLRRSTPDEFHSLQTALAFANSQQTYQRMMKRIMRSC